LDPFCGRGTTPLTALALGRKFIGIDAEIKYIEKARTRAAEMSEGLAKHSYNSPRDAITAALD
jgi:DNA modification methylase